MTQMDTGRQMEEWTAGERINHLHTNSHTHMQAMEKWQQRADGFLSLLKIQLMAIPLILSVLSLHLSQSPFFFSVLL